MKTFKEFIGSQPVVAQTQAGSQNANQNINNLLATVFRDPGPQGQAALQQLIQASSSQPMSRNYVSGTVGWMEKRLMQLKQSLQQPTQQQMQQPAAPAAPAAPRV